MKVIRWVIWALVSTILVETYWFVPKIVERWNSWSRIRLTPGSVWFGFLVLMGIAIIYLRAVASSEAAFQGGLKRIRESAGEWEAGEESRAFWRTLAKGIAFLVLTVVLALVMARIYNLLALDPLRVSLAPWFLLGGEILLLRPSPQQGKNQRESRREINRNRRQKPEPLDGGSNLLRESKKAGKKGLEISNVDLEEQNALLTTPDLLVETTSPFFHALKEKFIPLFEIR